MKPASLVRKLSGSLALLFVCATTTQSNAATFAGVTTHIGLDPNQRTQTQAEQFALGKKLIRDGVSWSQIEPTTKGQYVWTHPTFVAVEAYLNWCKINGISIIMALRYGNGLYASIYENSAAGNTARQAMANAAGALAARWKAKGYPIIGWEIWNEWEDTRYNPLGASQTSANLLSDLLSRVSPKVKANWPGMKIHFPTSTVRAHLFNNWYRNQLKLATPNPAPYFDVIDMHIYVNNSWLTEAPNYPPTLAGVKKIISEVRSAWSAKNMIISEMGWTSNCATIGNNCTTEADQATKLTTYFKGIMDDSAYNFVEHMVWYRLLDNGPGGDINYGLVRETGVRKPSFNAMKVLPAN